MFRDPPPDSVRRFRGADYIGIAVVAAAFVVAAAMSWRKWPDPFVDFGSQLYLPWKISTGSVLYQDINYLPGGPFSQCFDALLFKAFGVSLRTLVVCNLVLVGGLVLLIYRRFLRASDAWTSTIICLAIVLVFAFGQYSDRGNYNYITPYCMEIWHGLVISILAVAWLSDWVARPRARFLLGAGFCAGLVFMTKPDVFAALALAVAAAFALVAVSGGGIGYLLKSLCLFLLAAAIPLLGFALYFHRSEAWPGSLRSVAYAWVPLLTTSASQGPFYRWCLGLDTPGFNIRAMFGQFFALAVVLAVCTAVFRMKMNSPLPRLIAVGVAAALLALASGWDWRDCGRPLPLLSLVLCGILCVKYKEMPDGFPLLWSVFGLALLAKLGLFSRIWHYGFALAMPSFAGAIYLLLWELPKVLQKFGIHRSLWRGAVGLLVLTGIFSLFMQWQMLYQKKTVPVGEGGDTFMAFGGQTDPVGPAMAQALPWLETNLPPGATLAVLPEGVMVNYLVRRSNPTHYPVWSPPELAAFGQSNMVADFELHSPDFVMLLHRDDAEYGVKYFGQQAGFGLELMQWIGRNYEPALLIGAEPLQTSAFGIKILRRVSVTK